MIDFDSIPLHEALVSTVVIDYNSKKITINVKALSPESLLPVHCSICWEDYRTVSLPRMEPWGPSNSINSQRRLGNIFEIEMQSGDTIRIEANEFSFVQIPNELG